MHAVERRQNRIVSTSAATRQRMDIWQGVVPSGREHRRGKHHGTSFSSLGLLVKKVASTRAIGLPIFVRDAGIFGDVAGDHARGPTSHYSDERQGDRHASHPLSTRNPQ